MISQVLISPCQNEESTSLFLCSITLEPNKVDRRGSTGGAESHREPLHLLHMDNRRGVLNKAGADSK